jgi:hypothetical protein
VGYVDMILHLPYAYIWLPGLVFVVVVGAIYRLTRPAAALAQPGIGDAQVQPVIELTAPKAKDQRGMFRRQGNPVEVHVGAPAEKTNLQLGCVLDRSMGGMRLAMFREAEVGAVVSVKPTNADEMVPWVDLEVRSCRRSAELPDQFELGCQYVKSPPYSIQLLFG